MSLGLRAPAYGVDDALTIERDRVVEEAVVADELADALLDEEIALDALAELEKPKGILTRHAAAPANVRSSADSSHVLEPLLEPRQVDAIFVQRLGRDDEGATREVPARTNVVDRLQHGVDDHRDLRQHDGRVGGGSRKLLGQHGRGFRDDLALDAPGEALGVNLAVRCAAAQRPGRIELRHGDKRRRVRQDDETRAATAIKRADRFAIRPINRHANQVATHLGFRARPSSASWAVRTQPRALRIVSRIRHRDATHSSASTHRSGPGGRPRR